MIRPVPFDARRNRVVHGMFRVLSAEASDRFRIYLNDHRGVLAAEVALAKRTRDANPDGTLGGLLRSLVDQAEADQRVLDRLLDRFDGSANPFKKYGAIIGERLGRLKLNGQLSGYSPLSRVIEVEGLLASTSARRAMWNGIAAMEIDRDVTTDAARREAAASEQHSRLREHHVEAMVTAFDGR